MKIEKIYTAIKHYKQNEVKEKIDNIEVVDNVLIDIEDISYLVFNTEEYREVKKDSINSYLNDYGIYGFDSDLQNYILNNYVDEKIFIELTRQFFIEHVENTNIEEIKENMNNIGAISIKEYIQYNIDNIFNYVEFCKDTIKYNDLIDILEEKKAINWNGVCTEILYNDHLLNKYIIKENDCIKEGDFYIMEL